MIKTKLVLSADQKTTIFNQLLKNNEVKSVIHPADNILIFSFENGIKLFVNGHWKYETNNNIIVSHLADGESIEENFSKIEDFAEDISKKNLIVDEITWSNDKEVSIIFNNGSRLIVSGHNYKNEYLFVSLSFSSSLDDVHINVDYEDKQWIQRLVCMRKET
jgi:VCBS repeat-containing protein